MQRENACTLYSILRLIDISIDQLVHHINDKYVWIGYGRRTPTQPRKAFISLCRSDSSLLCCADYESLTKWQAFCDCKIYEHKATHLQVSVHSMTANRYREKERKGQTKECRTKERNMTESFHVNCHGAFSVPFLQFVWPLQAKFNWTHTWWCRTVLFIQSLLFVV